MAGLLSDRIWETRALLHHESLWLGPKLQSRLEWANNCATALQFSFIILPSGLANWMHWALIFRIVLGNWPHWQIQARDILWVMRCVGHATRDSFHWMLQRFIFHVQSNVGANSSNDQNPPILKQKMLLLDYCLLWMYYWVGTSCGQTLHWHCRKYNGVDVMAKTKLVRTSQVFYYEMNNLNK